MSEPSIDQAKLLEALRAGDDAAFETMVRAFGGRLLATTRRLLRNEADAMDAVQDAFLQAFKSIDSFEGQSQLYTWLHRIAVNAALMKLRTKRRRPETLIEDLLPKFQDDHHRIEPASEMDDTASKLAERAETRATVRECIEKLPESYRIVLVLRDIEEMDTAEAARVLGVSDGVVKTRLHRARQALKALLDPHFGGGRS